MQANADVISPLPCPFLDGYAICDDVVDVIGSSTKPEDAGFPVNGLDFCPSLPVNRKLTACRRASACASFPQIADQIIKAGSNSRLNFNVFSRALPRFPPRFPSIPHPGLSGRA
jgi:hypothetical protein